MASVLEQYPNLPGFASEFKDGGLQVRVENPEPGTDSVLLLGTAVDGPINEPVAVDPNTVELVFGGSTYPTGVPNGSTLVKAFHEAWAGGSRDIRLMRVSGTTAEAKLKGGSSNRTVEITKTERLGLAEGNKETTFTLTADTVDVNSVKVNAEGYDIPAAFVEVTNGSAGTKAKVKLKANAVSGGTSISITYKKTDGEAGYENGTITGGAITYWIAEGSDKLHTLEKTVKAGSLRLYANGVEVAAEGYTASGTSLTVKANFVDKDAAMEARYIHSYTEPEVYEVNLESFFGGAIYNQAKVKLEDLKDGSNKVFGKKVVITKPDTKKAQASEKALEYNSTDYPTLGQLVQAINADPKNNIVRASVSNGHNNVETTVLTTVEGFSKGTDGVNISKHEMFVKLGGTKDAEGKVAAPGVYHLLENYTVDTIIPLGVHADDELTGKYDNFAAQLALACAYISHRNYATNGVIATSSPDQAGLEAVQAHVGKLLASDNNYFMRDGAGNILKDSDARPIDLGRFISVVAGPDIVFTNSRTGNYAENSAAGYGGFVSQLPPQSAPTNKVMPFTGLRYNYSNAQLDKLTAARYVTFRMKNGQVAIVDGPTAAQADSDYRRISTTRVVKEVVNQLRDVCDPYIGEPGETPQQNAMSAAISKRLGQLVEAGVIVDFDFQIIATAQMRVMGEAQIELTIVPPFGAS